jgi:hypothetical protein
MKFNEKYNREDFIDFLNGFLPEDVADKKEEIQIKKERYKEITQAEVLGYSPSLDLYILEMDHSRENDPRIAIATDAFKILADHWIHRALVIFKNKESENYRLSYLTITPDINDKNKVIKRYSNARRYSFYLGTKAKIKTPYQQLIKKGRVKDLEDLLNRFSVEVVNREFYDEIQNAFDFLTGDGNEEEAQLKLPGMKNGVFEKDFAVRLIGRIMFCWFLKQKKTDSGQLIPEEILSSKAVAGNYYHNTLEKLFFEVLNTDKDNRDVNTELFDKVPYLNGGLFSPQSGDFYEFDRGSYSSKYINTLNIADGWFKNLFELLETYNFTIDENTAIDQELSVDPEMLGRIFENLLAKINPETGTSDRKKTGSFYTPRPIVEYMVDQSLLEYLKTKTNITEEKLSALISYDLNDDVEYPLTDEEKQKIVEAVDSLKVLDPACGSGAFPIGMLQKVVHILQSVDPKCELLLAEKLKGVPELYKQKIINDARANSFDYVRKLEIIKNSIFGVDIQPIAVDVSRLRCFLTLVVEAEINDNEKNRGIKPLPNLDFKFVCANTLIGAPEQNITKDSLFGDDFQEKLALAVDKYFSSFGENKRSANNDIHKLIDRKIDEKMNHVIGLASYGGDKKMEALLAKKNKNQIANHTNTLHQWESYKNIFENQPVGFFETKYFFPSVKEGFDIVIGNPPYVFARNGKNKGLSKDEKKYFYENFELAKYQINLYALFLEKGKKMLKEFGVLSYIIPNNWLTINTNKDLREFVLNFSDVTIVNFYAKVFESASVDSSILIFSNCNKNQRVSLFEFSDSKEMKLIKELPNDYFKNKKDFIINISSLKNDEVAGLIEKIESQSDEMNTLADVKAGLKAYETGKGNPPQSEQMKKERIYHTTQPTDKTYIKYLEGRDVSRYVFGWGGEYLKYGNNLAAPRKFELFSKPRILVRQIPSKPPYCINASYTEDILLNDLNSMNIVNIKENPLFILSILNSKLTSFWFIHKFGKLQRGIFPQFKINELEQFPILKCRQQDKENLVSLVTKILADKKTNPKADTSAQESEIDRLVYHLYDLKDEEIALIENSSKK